MKKLLIVLSVFLMVGCATGTPDKNYFQLTSDFSPVDDGQSINVKKTIWLEPVSVANYLNGNGIVYQMDEIEYVAANNNLWMTSLSNQIQQRLVQDLSALLPDYFVSNESTNQPNIKIKLFIDGFHGSYTGDAVISGRWLITTNQQSYTKNFSSLVKLKQDGYPALVKALSQGFQQQEIDLVKSLKR